MYVHGWLAPYSINLLFLHCLHCYDFCGMFLRKRFSTTRFAIWSYSRKIFCIYIYVFLYAFDACFRFCHTDKLYESSRRKPGWRFTAGCEYMEIHTYPWDARHPKYPWMSMDGAKHSLMTWWSRWTEGEKSMISNSVVELNLWWYFSCKSRENLVKSKNIYLNINEN